MFLFRSILASGLSLLWMVGTLICWDIARLHPDDSHTVTSLWAMYFNFRFASPLKEHRAYLEIEATADECKKVQVSEFCPSLPPLIYCLTIINAVAIIIVDVVDIAIVVVLLLLLLLPCSCPYSCPSSCDYYN